MHVPHHRLKQTHHKYNEFVVAVTHIIKMSVKHMNAQNANNCIGGRARMKLWKEKNKIK